MAITEAKLEHWTQKKNFRKLHQALEVPDHQIRSKAILCLGLLQNPASVPHIEKLIDDPFELVLRHAADAIKAIDPAHPAVQRFEQAALAKTQSGKAGTNSTESASGMTYQDYLDRQSRWERPKRIAFTILAIVGFGLILYILYQRLEWRDLLK